MATQYFIRDGGVDSGPFSFGSVADQIEDGTHPESILVRRADERRFLAASDVIGLLQTVERRRVAKARNADLPLGSPIAKPATGRMDKHGQRHSTAAVEWLRPGRLAISLLIANGLAFTLSQWSIREAQRFPSNGRLDGGGRFVPFIGECGLTVFTGSLIGLLVVSGTLMWLLLGWFERRLLRRME